MIVIIIVFIIGVLAGLGTAWWLGGRSLGKIVKREKEDIRDWLYYGKGKKYL